MRLATYHLLPLFMFYSSLTAAGVELAPPGKRDLRDPAVWQEKTPTPTARDMDEQCRRVRYSPCDYEQRALSDGEREAERREINRTYNQIKNGEWQKAKTR